MDIVSLINTINIVIWIYSILLLKLQKIKYLFRQMIEVGNIK
jgi:hypothetical protein